MSKLALAMRAVDANDEYTGDVVSDDATQGELRQTDEARAEDAAHAAIDTGITETVARVSPLHAALRIASIARSAVAVVAEMGGQDPRQHRLRDVQAADNITRELMALMADEPMVLAPMFRQTSPDERVAHGANVARAIAGGNAT